MKTCGLSRAKLARHLIVLVTVVANYFVIASARAEQPSILGVTCGVTPSELSRQGATLVPNDKAFRDKLGLDLNPIFSVAAVGPDNIETKLATRLPNLPENFQAAELRFVDGRLGSIMIAQKPEDDTKNGSRAQATINSFNAELVRKYGLMYRIEEQLTGAMGLSVQRSQVYQATVGTVRIGFVWHEWEPFPKSQVLTRIDFAENCGERDSATQVHFYVDFAYKRSQHFGPILSHLVEDKFAYSIVDKSTSLVFS